MEKESGQEITSKESYRQIKLKKATTAHVARASEERRAPIIEMSVCIVSTNEKPS